jgi:hypothetical protein
MLRRDVSIFRGTPKQHHLGVRHVASHGGEQRQRALNVNLGEKGLIARGNDTRTLDNPVWLNLLDHGGNIVLLRQVTAQTRGA